VTGPWKATVATFPLGPAASTSKSGDVTSKRPGAVPVRVAIYPMPVDHASGAPTEGAGNLLGAISATHETADILKVRDSLSQSLYEQPVKQSARSKATPHMEIELKEKHSRKETSKNETDNADSTAHVHRAFYKGTAASFAAKSNHRRHVSVTVGSHGNHEQQEDVQTGKRRTWRSNESGVNIYWGPIPPEGSMRWGSHMGDLLEDSPHTEAEDMMLFSQPVTSAKN